MDRITDLAMNQQRRGYFHTEPCVHVRGTNISIPNIHTVVTASGNTTNLDSHYLPDAYDNVMMNGVTQYTGVQHQHNLDMGAPAAANLYYSGMNPSSSTGVLPLPLNHRASDQLSGSSTCAVSGTYKRKNAKGIRGNYQHFNASASSSVAPPNARYTDGVAMMDVASFSLPLYRGNGFPPLVEVGPRCSSRSRSGESIMVHDHNHLNRGSYLVQHFQPAAPPRLDQQLNTLNVNESSLEDASMGLRRYHDIASNRSGLRFPPPPPINRQHHNFHHPTPPMQGMRALSVSFHPPAASYRVPINPSRSAAIPTQNDFQIGARHVGNATSTGQRIYRPHRGRQNLPSMDFIQVDDVAILVDHRRDMRLDIEDMSYEELLALGERIGNVSTGLSEEMITTQMKTKTYLIPSTAINLVVASEEQETDSCIICLDEYKIGEKIGILKCGHEYHADCLRKWLLVKNVCPICKSEALTPRGKKGV